MFLLFAERCPKCSNLFKAEAEPRADAPPGGEYRWARPRCYGALVAPGTSGRLSAVGTPWAVRATARTHTGT